MRAGIATVGLAAVIALSAGAPAVGDGGAKTQIKIQTLATTGASGKVTSRQESCVQGKKVTLFRFDDYVSMKIEIAKTNRKGAWRTKKDLEPGNYFAKVDASKGCRYAVSKNSTLR